MLMNPFCRWKKKNWLSFSKFTQLPSIGDSSCQIRNHLFLSPATEFHTLAVCLPFPVPMSIPCVHFTIYIISVPRPCSHRQTCNANCQNEFWLKDTNINRVPAPRWVFQVESQSLTILPPSFSPQRIQILWITDSSTCKAWSKGLLNGPWLF